MAFAKELPAVTSKGNGPTFLQAFSSAALEIGPVQEPTRLASNLPSADAVTNGAVAPTSQKSVASAQVNYGQAADTLHPSKPQSRIPQSQGTQSIPAEQSSVLTNLNADSSISNQSANPGQLAQNGTPSNAIIDGSSYSQQDAPQVRKSAVAQKEESRNENHNSSTNHGTAKFSKAAQFDTNAGPTEADALPPASVSTTTASVPDQAVTVFEQPKVFKQQTAQGTPGKTDRIDGIPYGSSAGTPLLEVSDISYADPESLAAPKTTAADELATREHLDAQGSITRQEAQQPTLRQKNRQGSVDPRDTGNLVPSKSSSDGPKWNKNSKTRAQSPSASASSAQTASPSVAIQQSSQATPLQSVVTQSPATYPTTSSAKVKTGPESQSLAVPIDSSSDLLSASGVPAAALLPSASSTIGPATQSSSSATQPANDLSSPAEAKTSARRRPSSQTRGQSQSPSIQAGQQSLTSVQTGNPNAGGLQPQTTPLHLSVIPSPATYPSDSWAQGSSNGPSQSLPTPKDSLSGPRSASETSMATSPVKTPGTNDSDIQSARSDDSIRGSNQTSKVMPSGEVAASDEQMGTTSGGGAVEDSAATQESQNGASQTAKDETDPQGTSAIASAALPATPDTQSTVLGWRSVFQSQTSQSPANLFTQGGRDSIQMPAVQGLKAIQTQNPSASEQKSERATAEPRQIVTVTSKPAANDQYPLVQPDAKAIQPAAARKAHTESRTESDVKHTAIPGAEEARNASTNSAPGGSDNQSSQTTHPRTATPSSQHPGDPVVSPNVQSGSANPTLPNASQTTAAANVSSQLVTTQPLAALAQDSKAASLPLKGEMASPAVTTSAIPVAAINTSRLIQTMTESEMRVGLASPEFGNLSIRTTINSQQLIAQITSDHGDLTRALNAHLPAAQEKLAHESGLNTVIEVRGQGSSMAGSAREHSQGTDRRPYSAPSTTTTTLPEAGTRSATALYSTTSDGRLDIRA